MHLPYAPGVHLTYCSNVHAADDVAQLLSNVTHFGPQLRERLGAIGPLGLGLHISSEPARELILGGRLPELRETLEEHKLYVFTLNGFPYDNFHGSRVKSAVFAPDWRDRRRLEYTQLLTRVLAELLPAGLEGGISTVPISMKEWVHHPSAVDLAESYLVEWIDSAMDLREGTGKVIHLDLEPEPAGWLETSLEVVTWYESFLLAHGAKQLALRRGIGRHSAEEAIRTHLRVCYDTCHLAVRFEEPRLVFERFARHGIQIGKLQISSALRVLLPPQLALREEIGRQLTSFAEPTYLHQVVELGPDGAINYLGDLENVLPSLTTTRAREWRIHYHVPLFATEYGLLQSTQRDASSAIYEALRHNIAHWEIETYTWDLLPERKRTTLLDQLTGEYRWVTGRIQQFAASPHRRAA